jgi:hypothetical protein
MRALGYLHCNVLYRRIFTIDAEDRLFRKGDLIPWNHIVAYRRFEGIVGILSGRPRTTFYLADGNRFSVYPNLMDERKKPKFGLRLVSEVTGDYQDFVRLVLARSQARNLRQTKAGKLEGLWLVSGLVGGILVLALHKVGFGVTWSRDIRREAVGVLAQGVFIVVGIMVQLRYRRKHLRKMHPGVDPGARHL